MGNSDSALLTASRRGDVAEIRSLLDQGIRPGGSGISWVRSPLHAHNRSNATPPDAARSSAQML